MNEFDIAKFRKSKGLKQTEFASLIGIAQPYLSEMESGKRPVSKDVYNKVKAAFPDDDFSNDILFIRKNESPITLNEAIKSFREDQYLAIIESQQRTIESLSKTIENLSRR